MNNTKTKRKTRYAATPNFRWTATINRPQHIDQRYSRAKSSETKNHIKSISVAIVIIVTVIGLFAGNFHRASAASPQIRSGIAGYCMDDHHNGSAANSEVDSWICNNTASQDWTFNGDIIKHGNNDCLDVQNEGTSQGSGIVLNNCNGSNAQMWTTAVNGYENVNSGLCLAVPDGKTDVQLILSSCKQLANPSEMWTLFTSGDTKQSVSSLSCNTGSEGEEVACYAAQQWSIWQSGSPSHTALLNTYSDGNGYEEWCADFVSYIYKEAGHLFTQGERNGWDEYDANNIENMGFTEHSAADYQPKAGDIAFFDYSGGHVEIVAVGGQKPIFIYGDSGTTDPTTGNGDMAENGITNDGSLGQVVYYFSPS